MSAPFVLGDGTTVQIEPPPLPEVVAPPLPDSTVVVVPVVGPPGPKGDPGTPGDVVALAWLHTQDTPSTVWIIDHPLPFVPAAIDVTEHTGTRHFPQVSYPSPSTVQLTFSRDVRGTARLS